MKNRNQYKSDVSASIHKTISDLHDIGIVDKQTMHRFDASCLTPVEPLSAEDIKKLREEENVSQDVFSRYLNISKNHLSAWERGVKTPSGPALKLLLLVRKGGLEAIA